MKTMKSGEVKIKLTNSDEKDIGEYIITDGTTHTLYSPYGDREINQQQLTNILRVHANGMTLADLAVVLMSPDR